MYSPPYNQVENQAEAVAFMRANNFALLVTGTGATAFTTAAMSSALRSPGAKRTSAPAAA